MALYDEIAQAIQDVINTYKQSVADGKLSLQEIFTLSHSAIASFVRLAESVGGYSGAEKKAAVLAAIDQFYDEVIAPIDVQSIPNFLEPVVDRALKQLIRVVAESTIDSLVNIFNKTGWGKPTAGDTTIGFEPY